MRKAVIFTLALLSMLIFTGCARKQISVEETGSFKVEGTNWYRFCDGPNAVLWTKGLGGDSDEIEAYVYDHWACAPDFYGDEKSSKPEDPARGDDDGILEDED